jgi:twitching motility protein PilT
LLPFRRCAVTGSYAQGKRGRTFMAMEILTVTPAVRNVIREEKVHQIMNIMQGGAIHHMKTLDMALRDLFVQGNISYEEAFSKAQDPANLTDL